MKPNVITFMSEDKSAYFHIDFDKDIITISQLTASGTSKSSVEVKYSEISELVSTVNDMVDDY